MLQRTATGPDYYVGAPSVRPPITWGLGAYALAMLFAWLALARAEEPAGLFNPDGSYDIQVACPVWARSDRTSLKTRTVC